MRDLLTASFLTLLLACGAKTGLYVPDADVDVGVDAGMDAGVDAGPPPPLCVEVPRDAGPVEVRLAVPARLAVVDVMFVLDATASMLDEIETIRRRLVDVVVPGIRGAIPDAAFGVALTGEFPVLPHGLPPVQPYDLRAPITTDALRVQSALERLPTWDNLDEPEAQVEGLYQVATGEGLEPFIPPSAGCPSGGSGGACFRRDALPVVMVITDAPMNNGPTGMGAYAFEGPHTWEQTRRALVALEAKLIGLGARDAFSLSPMPDLRAAALATGAVNGAGGPLAFDIGSRGGGLGGRIVEAVQQLADGTPLDIDAIVQDVPGDAIDATLLVRQVRPRSASPPDGVAAVEADRFVGVRPGTVLTFELVLDAAAAPPSTETLAVRARVVFRAFRRSRIDRREVLLIIPGDDGGSCESL